MPIRRGGNGNRPDATAPAPPVTVRQVGMNMDKLGGAARPPADNLDNTYVNAARDAIEASRQGERDSLRPGGGRIDSTGRLTEKGYMDEVFGGRDAEDLAAMKEEQVGRNIDMLRQGAAGRGMANMGSTAAMSNDVYRAAARDLAAEQNQLKRHKIGEKVRASGLAFRDKWKEEGQAHDFKMAELENEFKIKLAEALNALQQGNPGPLAELVGDSNKAGIGQSFGISALTGIPGIGETINYFKGLF